MTDRVNIVEPTGGWTEDVNGDQVPETVPVHTSYRGVPGGVPAWIRVLAQQSRIVEVGGEPVTLLAYDVLLPHDVDGLQVDQLVEVAATDGTDLLGRTLTVIETTWGSHQVARRLVVRAHLR
jgi:hypothetical protein